MITVTLIGKTLFIVGDDSTVVGRTYKTYNRAVAAYLIVCRKIDRCGMLHADSCIE